MKQKRIINIIGNSFTFYGISTFLVGVFTGMIELTQVGLLAMILGELVNG